MEFTSLLIIALIALFVVFFGRILTHALKFIFYLLLIVLVVVFIFGISFTDLVNFLKSLIFTTF